MIVTLMIEDSDDDDDICFIPSLEDDDYDGFLTNLDSTSTTSASTVASYTSNNNDFALDEINVTNDNNEFLIVSSAPPMG